MKPTKLRSGLEFISSLVKNYFRVDLSSLGAANSGLFIPNENRLHSLSMQASFHALVSTILARLESAKMSKRVSDKPKSRFNTYKR